MSDSGGEFVFSVTFWLKHQVSVRTVKDNQIANRLIIVICILQYLVEPPVVYASCFFPCLDRTL